MNALNAQEGGEASTGTRSHRVITTTAGSVLGAADGGVARFTGIRYGQLRNGARFDPVSATTTLSRGQDLRELPAVFPQLPSRLGQVMGFAVDEHPQEEDAFLLNVFAPADAIDAPVLFFIHGGAFVSGGGTTRWYDGSRLAADGLVVVTVNYRLGPLGHLTLGTPDGDANRPVADLLEALRWVHLNIASFGGDPRSVTISGQSAGAWYAQLLAAIPETRGRVKRALILSSPTVLDLEPDWLDELSSIVTGGLGAVTPPQSGIDELLLAHRSVLAREVPLGTLSVGLSPCAGGVVPEWWGDLARAASVTHVEDVYVSYTRDELGSFFFRSPRERGVDWGDARSVAASAGLSDSSIAAASSAYSLLVTAVTESAFGAGARDYTDALQEQGVRAELHVFTSASPLDGVGAGHCYELPFLFGNRDDWGDAPMLSGISDEQFEVISSGFRREIVDFVKFGIPRTV